MNKDSQIKYLHSILDEKYERNHAVVIIGINQAQLQGILDISNREGKPFVQLIDEMITQGIRYKNNQLKEPEKPVKKKRFTLKLCKIGKIFSKNYRCEGEENDAAA